MKGSIIFVFFVLAMSFLSLGTVVERKDAIRRTQTDPISYEEKQKEEKEGKKGPPAPTLKLFPKERFLTEGPVDKQKAEPEEIAPIEEEEIDWDLWLEEDEEEGEDEGEFKLDELEDDTSPAGPLP